MSIVTRVHRKVAVHGTTLSHIDWLWQKVRNDGLVSPGRASVSLEPVAPPFEDGGLFRFRRFVLERKALRVVHLLVMPRQRRLAAVAFVAVFAGIRTDAGMDAAVAR